MRPMKKLLAPHTTRMMQPIFLSAHILLIATLLANCANLQTIGRTTSVEEGTAIHLDAQQRLLVVSAEKYCAEPSPDALSAYVASLGLSAPGTRDGASFAETLQSSAGSIGLRTQSITLMRDALYRMCEASNNGHLNDLEVAAFLRRSQTLTAVVLAIEQLTGTIAANQVILTPNSTNGAAAALVENQKLLDQAERTFWMYQTEVTKAQDNVNKLTEARDAALVARDVALEKYKRSRNAQSGIEPIEEKAAADRAEITHQESRGKVDQAKSELNYLTNRLRDAEEVVAVVRASRNDALTDSATRSEDSDHVSIIVPRQEPSVEGTVAIAEAVVDMVTRVLNRNDIADLCMSFYISKYHRTDDDDGTPDGVDDSVEAEGTSGRSESVSRICSRFLRLYATELKNQLTR